MSIKDNKLVSVIITSYNRYDFLQESVESVLSQTYKDKEIIVLDDNSPDKRIDDYLSSLAKNGDIIYYQSEVSEELRFVLTRYAVLINYGVMMISSGELITYLADDDYFYPNRLEVMVNFLNENPHVRAAFGPQDVVDVNKNKTGVRFRNEVLENGFDILDHNQVIHYKDIFMEVSGWPVSPDAWGGADSWFWDRISKAGYKFYPIPGESLDAKRYHVDAVQWKVGNGSFFS